MGALDFARYEQYTDLMGQIAFVRTYIQLSFCFPLQADKEDVVVDELKAASRRLAQDIPYLNGQVVQTVVKEGSSGIFRIASYDEHEKNTFIHVKRVPELHYDAIIRAKGLFSDFNADVIAPRQNFLLPYDPTSGPAPVFIIQANFISGGLILTFAGQHNIMDMNGYAKCIQYFAKALNHEPLTTEELTEALRDRRNICPLLKDGETGPDLASEWLMSPDSPPPTMAPCRWTTWHFPAENLARLKAQVNAECEFKEGVRYLTTNDALVALFWKTLTSIRATAGEIPPSSQVQFGRVIDARKILLPPVSQLYMGQMVVASFSKSTAAHITQAPLWESAFLIRQATNRIDDTWCRSMGSLWANTANKDLINPMATMDMSKDVAVTSWVSHPLQKLTFGSLGQTDLLRMPTPAPLSGLAILMPQTREGGVDLCIALGEQTIEMLKGDAGWMDACEYIG